MTIREIEVLSGMTRANIRFYESEGLLTPNRMENGYRDYTRSDLDTLHKIRLLRALGLGIDVRLQPLEIVAVRRPSRTLTLPEGEMEPPAPAVALMV